MLTVGLEFVVDAAGHDHPAPFRTMSQHDTTITHIACAMLQDVARKHFGSARVVIGLSHFRHMTKHL